MSPTVSVTVWGEYALFTRPELSVERLSYPFMTPSAARGVLDAIMFRPQMRWHVRSIAALRPRTFPPGFPTASANQHHRLIGVRRNEIQGTIAPGTVAKWMKGTEAVKPYLVDYMGDKETNTKGNRTPRNTLMLHHVAYRIDASPVLTEKANLPRTRAEDDEDRGPDSVTKYAEMFKRRVRKGQCFHRPYLGCREFAAMFAEPSEKDEVLSGWNDSLGFMLYDQRATMIPGKPQPGHYSYRPGFFDAKVVNGVLHCDTEGPNPICIYGWAAEGSEQ